MIDTNSDARLVVARIAASLVSVCRSPAPAFAQGAPAGKWFRYAAAIDTAWTVTEVPGNPLQFEIQRKAKAKRLPLIEARPRALSARVVCL